MLFDPKIIEELSRKLSEGMPPGIATLKNETEQHINSVLQSGFSKLNLVPREEFDIQQGVLQRTRGKLDALEKRVAELEAKLK